MDMMTHTSRTQPATPNNNAHTMLRAINTQNANAPTGKTTRTIYARPRPTVRIRIPDGWAKALLSGVQAALMGWAFATLVCIGVYAMQIENPWMASVEWSDVMAAGTTLWGMALGSSIIVPEGASEAGFPPLLHATPLLLSFLAVLILRVLLLTGRRFPSGAYFFALPGFVGMSAFLVAANHAWVGWGRFLIGASMCALIAVLWAYVEDRQEAFHPQWLQRLPQSSVNNVLRGLCWSGVACVYLLVVSAVVMLVGVGSRWQALVDITTALHPANGAEIALILIAQAFFVPNAFAWTLSWLSGAGVSLGGDSIHSVTQATVAPIPPIPLLGALPTQAPGAWWVVLPIVFSVAVGAAYGRGIRRDVSPLDDLMSVGVLLLSMWAGLVVWLRLSQMVLGSGRLAFLGPQAVPGATLLVVEILVPLSGAFMATHPEVLNWIRQRLQSLRGAGGCASVIQVMPEVDSLLDSELSAESDVLTQVGTSVTAVADEMEPETAPTVKLDLVGQGNLPEIQTVKTTAQELLYAERQTDLSEQDKQQREEGIVSASQETLQTIPMEKPAHVESTPGEVFGLPVMQEMETSEKKKISTGNEESTEILPTVYAQHSPVDPEVETEIIPTHGDIQR